MGTPYIGEIRMFGGNFAPVGWMTCDGQLLPISEYEPLYTLIGTTYGGDGVQNFALPNLAARIPIHMATSGGSSYPIGTNGGTPTVTLTTAQLPSHPHNFIASGAPASQSSPANAYVAKASANFYVTSSPGAQMNGSSVAPSGGSLPHDNMMPYLAVTFIISLFGVYPTQS